MIKRDRSDRSHAILDVESRHRKAEKIVKILQQKTDLSKSKVLEIGTGSGYIAQYIARYARKVISIDVVDERRTKYDYVYERVSNEFLPFEDASFDIVISNHVVEHVTNQRLHLNEALRALKTEGLLYLAAPNRLWITDPHYRLPFINWMPYSFAKFYLKTFKGSFWDIYPVTEKYLKKCILEQNKHAKFETVAPEILKNPERYNLDVGTAFQPFLKRMPLSLLQLTRCFLPTILVVITKGRQ